MAEAKRKLAAILSADVAGYWRLMDDDEAARVETLTKYRRLYRDAKCLTHHISANRYSFEMTGRARCGFDPLELKV